MKATTFDHTSWVIYQSDIHPENSGISKPSLLLGNKDKSYARVILNNYYAQTPFYTSPDLRHLLVNNDGALTLYYLGVRQKPQMLYELAINSSGLAGDDRESFLKYRNLDRAFQIEVFGPQINPLNSKVVGPNQQVFKGCLMVQDWHDTSIVARTVLETMPFGEGDIGANVHSGYDQRGNCYMFRDQWYVLHASEQAEHTQNGSGTPTLTGTNAMSPRPIGNQNELDRYEEYKRLRELRESSKRLEENMKRLEELQQQKGAS